MIHGSFRIVGQTAVCFVLLLGNLRPLHLIRQLTTPISMVGVIGGSSQEVVRKVLSTFINFASAGGFGASTPLVLDDTHDCRQLTIRHGDHF
jgi:hypothetical protein